MVQFFSSPEINVIKTFKSFFFFFKNRQNVPLSALLSGEFPLSRNFSVCMTRVNKIETMNGRSRIRKS